jgi:hypothetical protein
MHQHRSALLRFFQLCSFAVSFLSLRLTRRAAMTDSREEKLEAPHRRMDNKDTTICGIHEIFKFSILLFLSCLIPFPFIFPFFAGHQWEIFTE